MSLDARITDIRELDPAGWWPLALGWWLVMASVVLLIVLGYFVWRVWRDRQHRWRRDARLQRVALCRALRGGDPKVLASELSQLIRRVAMARCGRQACAGLTGPDWLAWLSANDPRGFDWSREAKPLLALPYAPEGNESDRRAIRRLLGALQPWIDTDADPARAAARPARGDRPAGAVAPDAVS